MNDLENRPILMLPSFFRHSRIFYIIILLLAITPSLAFADISPTPDAAPIWRQMISWILCLELLTVVGLPFCLLALPNLRDSGISLSPIIGSFLFVFILWFLNSLGHIQTSVITVQLALLCGLVISLVILFSRMGQPYIQGITRPLILTNVIWIGGFLLFCAIRAYQPEVIWGEKPMDSSFLRYFVREEVLPPQDPWAAGIKMHYYYFGTYFFAILHKLSGVSPSVGYNLSLATIGIFLVLATYSLALIVTNTRWLSLVAGFVITLGGNPDVFWRTFSEKATAGFDLFWASTRIYTSPAFSEYPLWALIFGDLHAHVIALPFVVTLFTLLAQLFEQRDRISLSGLTHRLLLGIIWGMLIVANTWDFITCGIAILFILIVRIFVIKIPWWKRIGEFVSDGLIISLIAFVTCSPGIDSIFSGRHVVLNLAGGEEYNHAGHILRMFGYWLIPIFFSSIFLINKTLHSPRLFGVLIFGLIPWLAAIYPYSHGITNLPFGVLTIASLLFISSAIALLRGSVTFVPMGIFIAALLFTGTELFVLESRMNTIFKFYNPIWILLGVYSFGLCALIWRTQKLFPKTLVTTVLIGTILCTLASGVYTFICMIGFHRVPGPRPTLDGTAYLSTTPSGDTKIIEWLNAHAQGTPVIAEAFGPSYQNFTRIAMHTGLPTFLGWDYHVFQRGVNWPDIDTRKAAILELYNSPDPQQKLEIIKKYNIKYIVVGGLERETYTPMGLKAFRTSPEFFEPLVNFNGSIIYGLKMGTLPNIEKIG